MKKSKGTVKLKVFKGIFSALFVIFLVLYFSEKSGYYEFKNSKMKSLTDKQVKKFESDVNSGKEVNLKEYVIPKNYNYQNNISQTGLNISNFISAAVQKGLNGTFSVVIKLIEE